MNKYKKIATAVVSTVMAGTMVASLAACNPDKPNNNGGGTTGKDLYGILNSDGSINYDAYKRDTPVTLNTSIGDNNVSKGTHFPANMGVTITLPDGNSYTNSDLKPTWVALGKELNINWTSIYSGKNTGANLDTLVGVGGGYDTTDIFTTDLSKVIENLKDVSILNLGEYLDYMPNFQKFLNDNPVVYLSLLQSGMITSGENAGENKSLYVAPYFDGNDDIERYCLIRQDWAEKLLNGDTQSTSTTTFASECGTATSVASFMGSENYTIESLNATGTAKQNITKNYTAVVEALKATTDNALKTAYNAIDSNGYSGNSGNIIDVMNAALTANNAATGPQLLNLFRAYIDVCYGNVYTPATRANLFNGYDAAWDVDDLVAMLRVVKTNASYVAADKDGGGQRNVIGITPRENNMDRTPDMVRLACQLYGVRGADSRFENTYIDGNGNLQDARLDKEFYEALERFHTLAGENLIADYSTVSNSLKYGISKNAEAFFMYDYNQTQTMQNFFVEDDSITGDGNATPDGYKFAPVMTPVSRWDTDGNKDNGHETLMRFTESWRSTKTSGLALNGNLANKGNEEKLKAALQFVDYLYSEDGQILSTFGPRATDANGTGGFWYDEQASSTEIAEGKYYTYKGVKYSGYEYKGEYKPTITQKLYDSFTYKEVNGYKITTLPDKPANMTVKLSFTDYARKLMGSALPLGVKSQALEDQLTSATGRAAAKKVGVALSEQFQTIKGMTLKLDVDNLWYTCVPTGLPTNSLQNGQLNDDSQDAVKFMTGTQQSSADKPKEFHTIFNYIILNGATGTYSRGQDTGVTYTFASTNPIDKLVEDMGKAVANGGLGENVRLEKHSEAWTLAKNYWNYQTPKND